MFGRLMNVIKGLLNQGISKVETPEILAEQHQMELESSAKQLKEALITAITAEKALEQKIQKDSEDVATWQKRAELAISKGDEDLAKQCLQKRQEAEQGLAHLKTQLDAQKSATKALRDRNNEQEQKLRDFATKKKDMIARANASTATAKVNELLSNSGGSSSLDKIEDKIRATELRNEAIADLRAGGDKALEDKIKELDATSDLDSELLKLKMKVLEQKDTPPKLIEVREKEMKALPGPSADAITVEEVDEK
jgi:phage shock protein A